MLSRSQTEQMGQKLIMEGRYIFYIVVQNKRTSKYWETIGKLVLVNIRKY